MDISSEVEKLQLLDITSEDDYLIAYPFRNSLEDLRLSVTFENTNARDRFELFGDANSESEINKQKDHVIPEIVEPQRPSFMRKSLAWDSEFFTSRGVLDHEELSLINKGFKKAEVRQLPRIREDVRMCRSADSKSTVKVFNKANAGPRNKLKSVSASKSESIKMGHISQHSGSKESYMLSPKPPRISHRSDTNLAKQKERASLVSDTVKMDQKTRKTRSGPDLSVSKKSRLDLPDFTSSHTPPPKSASSLSPLGIRDTTLRYRPYDPIYSASSSIHSSKSTTREMKSRDITLGPSSSALPLSLMSNHSSCTSPASSTDGWFSEAVSSTSFARKRCYDPTHNRETASTKGSQLVNNSIKASDSQSHLPEQSSACQEIEGTKFTSQPSKRALIGTGSVSAESKRQGKSSALRMPSPKIGFFDEEQSTQPIMRGRVGFHLGEQSPLANNYGPTSEKRPSRFRYAKTLQEPNHSSTMVMVRERSSKIRKSGMGSALGEEGLRAKGVSRNKISIDRKRQKDDTCVQGRAINPFMKKHEEATLDLLGSNLSSLHESQKENICNFEDQVNGLGRYFEGVDLNKDVAREVNGKLSQKLHDQKQGPPETSIKPGPLSLAAAVDLTPRTRTALADRTSVSNRGRLLGLSTESAIDMMIEKPTFQPSESI